MTVRAGRPRVTRQDAGGPLKRVETFYFDREADGVADAGGAVLAYEQWVDDRMEEDQAALARQPLLCRGEDFRKTASMGLAPRRAEADLDLTVNDLSRHYRFGLGGMGRPYSRRYASRIFSTWGMRFACSGSRASSSAV